MMRMRYLLIPIIVIIDKILLPLPGISHCHIQEVFVLSLVFQRIYIYLEHKAMTIKVNEVNKLEGQNQYLEYLGIARPD